MYNFAQDIEEAADGDAIEAIVIGEFGWGGWGGFDESNPIPKDKRNVVLTWDQARPLLDYQYHIGYGAPDCHAITVWTESKVMWVTQYDGATRVSTAPRHPIDHEPEMPGG